MSNSADPDQLAYKEANWSGYTLFAKAGHVKVQQDESEETSTESKKDLLRFTDKYGK